MNRRSRLSGRRPYGDWAGVPADAGPADRHGHGNRRHSQPGRRAGARPRSRERIEGRRRTGRRDHGLGDAGPNNQLLSDKIFTQTTGYISTYKIVKERPDTETNIYSVTVEATVKEGNLQDDLNSMGLLLRRMKMPRICVAIQETGWTASTPDAADAQRQGLPGGGHGRTIS